MDFHNQVRECDNSPMNVTQNVALQSYNSFGIVAKAYSLLRIGSAAEAVEAQQTLKNHPEGHCILGGGSNIVLTGDVRPLVLKMEILGKRLVSETDKAWIVEAGAGEDWHELVTWTLDQGWPGLENLALIPGSVGASPVQNIGAYGVELQDRFDSLDALDLVTGQVFSLNAAQCAFGYRDSVFKHASSGPNGIGLAGRALILRVRFHLPKKWKPVLGYLDLERKMTETGIAHPTAQQIDDWVKRLTEHRATVEAPTGAERGLGGPARGIVPSTRPTQAGKLQLLHGEDDTPDSAMETSRHSPASPRMKPLRWNC
jgi:UDP-N-acetylmuramate dehydrogenase